MSAFPISSTRLYGYELERLKNKLLTNSGDMASRTDPIILLLIKMWQPVDYMELMMVVK